MGLDSGLSAQHSPDVKRTVLVLTHAAWETPGLIDVAFQGLAAGGGSEHNDVVQRRMVLHTPTPSLPRVEDLAGLVVMGGPQDANDDVQYPGLAAERRLLAEATAAGVPVLGVCLGMQLLAMSLGATLLLRHGREIGIAPVTYTEAGRNDPVLGPISRCRSIDGEAAPVLHWHSDAVELPSGATLLASTPLTPVQAFRLGSALGLQFHPEVDTELLTTWLDEPTMVQGLSREHVEEMRESGVRQLPALRPSALLGLQQFVASVNERL